MEIDKLRFCNERKRFRGHAGGNEVNLFAVVAVV